MCHRFLASAIFWATRARVDGYKCELKDEMHNDSGVSRAYYSGNTRSLATSGFTLLTFAQREVEVEDVVLAVSKPAIWRCLCALAVVPRAQPSRAIAAATRFTAVLSEECRSAHLEAGHRIKCADDVEAAAPTAATAASRKTAAPPPAGESERMTIAICNLYIYISYMAGTSGRPNNAQQTFLRRMSVAVAAETRLCLLLLR